MSPSTHSYLPQLPLGECRNKCPTYECQCAVVEDSVDSSSSEDTLLGADDNRYERTLGDTELSYFLPSRDSGVNDMYLHLGCHAHPHLVRKERIQIVWAIFRIRHPLLASKVEMRDYNDVRFSYIAPYSVEDALDSAGTALEFRTQNKDELIDTYLNGPRTLSNDRLAYLIVSLAAQSTSITSGLDCHFLICATHFVGDGMALHQFANDFFSLLGSSLSTTDLTSMLSSEWHSRCGKVFVTLPNHLEDRLPPVTGKLCELASRVDFQRSQDKLIGGHTFPRSSGAPRHTVVSTMAFDADRTKKMLKNCKSHGVSISSALFALCNVAWAKTSDVKWELPMMMYSALNMRPYVLSNRALNDSYWYLAIGYFNVVLPAFLPRFGNVKPTFWHRARSAKAQSTDAAKSPMIVARSREMAHVRGARARAWAKEDDDKARGVWKAPPSAPEEYLQRAPSNVLLGLSLLGNLDGIYKHAVFSGIELHTLTTGSRQRSGGMLLFGYTFVGKLWLSLGYDENGFDKGTVDKFWSNLLHCVDDLLIE